jgi:hypothetical protein
MFKENHGTEGPNVEVLQLRNKMLSPFCPEPTRDNIYIIVKGGRRVGKSQFDPSSLAQLILCEHTLSIVFIAAADTFSSDHIIKTLSGIMARRDREGISLLVPYVVAPVSDSREDGFARSLVIESKYCSAMIAQKYTGDFARLSYELVYAYLNSDNSNNLKVFQVGKNLSCVEPVEKLYRKEFKDSAILIPHKGPLYMLRRCLRHLSDIKIPTTVRIFFDDTSYKKIAVDEFNRVQAKVSLSFNRPLNSGPYLGRHFSILKTDKKYIFFQDSDDISLKSRYFRQISELKQRGLDMVGSHELRIDQFKKSIVLVRFPEDVNYAFSKRAHNPLFHPTSLITKSAYLKTGGFSTNLKFGYDLQLAMRANFLIKMGNVDDFLYIRFRRQHSLTTSKKTEIGTSLRSFLWWRWRIEMRLVAENKLDLKKSSLWIQKHEFAFKMIEIP